MRGWLKQSKLFGALCALVLCTGALHAQNPTSFYTLQPRVGFYQMAEKGWEPLTLHLTAVDLILNQGARTTVYLGPRMAGNFLGVRAGYISLGAHAGMQHQLNRKLTLRAEIDGSAGGGGYAQDGDGWVLGSTSSLIYGGRTQRLEVGLTYHYASGGMIGGFSPYLGWNRSIQLVARPSSYGVEKFRAGERNAVALPASVGLFVQPSVGRQPYGDPEGDQAYPFTMLGAELRFESPRMHHALSVSAAADTFGGYMLVMNTLTPKVTQGKVQLNPQLHLGAGGGGRSIHYYGGLHYGLGLEGAVNLGRQGRWGQVYWNHQFMFTNGPWSYQADQVGLRVPLTVARVPRANEVPTHKAVPRYTLELGVGAKGYRSDSLWAACVGGEVRLLHKGPLSVYGSTWWAAVGGNLGAYAEGLLHTKIEIVRGIALTASAGRGAGGGVNHLGDSYIAGIGAEFGRLVPIHVQYWQGAPTRFSIGVVKKMRIPLAGIDR
jgi:hypothetical protein